jgi:hypothetical protein
MFVISADGFGCPDSNNLDVQIQTIFHASVYNLCPALSRKPKQQTLGDRESI